ncbi:twin-arginine translocation signal domain-containing protein, partial [Vibrio diabolicus]
MDISRRRFLQSSLAISALTVLPACSLSRSANKQGQHIYDITAEPSTA